MGSIVPRPPHPDEMDAGGAMGANHVAACWMWVGQLLPPPGDKQAAVGLDLDRRGEREAGEDRLDLVALDRHDVSGIEVHFSPAW